jgi:hypothetical protein
MEDFKAHGRLLGLDGYAKAHNNSATNQTNPSGM